MGTRDRGQLWELVLSFHHADSGEQTQASQVLQSACQACVAPTPAAFTAIVLGTFIFGWQEALTRLEWGPFSSPRSHSFPVFVSGLGMKEQLLQK